MCKSPRASTSSAVLHRIASRLIGNEFLQGSLPSLRRVVRLAVEELQGDLIDIRHRDWSLTNRHRANRFEGNLRSSTCETKSRRMSAMIRASLTSRMPAALRQPPGRRGEGTLLREFDNGVDASKEFANIFVAVDDCSKKISGDENGPKRPNDAAIRRRCAKRISNANDARNHSFELQASEPEVRRSQ